MCYFFYRQQREWLWFQTADHSLLPTSNGRLTQLQCPTQGISPTTTSPRRKQTFQTAWASFWPGSSLVKVWLALQDRRETERENEAIAFPFSHLITYSYFPLLHIHPSAACIHSCCVSVPPSGISHRTPPFIFPCLLSLSNISVRVLQHFLPLVVYLPTDLALCSLCHCASLFSLSSKHCVTMSPAELTDTNRKTASQHE